MQVLITRWRRNVLVVAISCCAQMPSFAEARDTHFPIPMLTPGAIAQCESERRLGMDAVGKGDWAASAEHFKKAIEAFPDSHSDWYNLACALARLRMTEDALHALRKASSLAPLIATQVESDSDLESLHPLAAFGELLRTLRTPPAAVIASYAKDELAQTREELSRVSAEATRRLTAVESVLAFDQFERADAAIAQWKAASLDAMVVRTTDAAESDQLHWDALRSLLDDAMVPRSQWVVQEVLRRAASPAIAHSAHWIDAGYASAMAHWMVTVVDSQDALRPEANARYRADLLAIAASANDVPELERVLVRLGSLTIDDLPLSTRIYRRLVKLSADPVAARKAARFEAPGAVLSAEGLPAFVATTTTGTQLTKASLGGHVTLLHLWATWCRPCHAELPKVRALYDDYKERGLDLVGIASEVAAMTEPKAFAEWCTAHDVGWPQVLDTESGDKGLSAAMGVERIPHLLLIDREGRVVAAGNQVEYIKPELERLLPAAPAQTGQAAPPSAQEQSVTP